MHLNSKSEGIWPQTQQRHVYPLATSIEASRARWKQTRQKGIHFSHGSSKNKKQGRKLSLQWNQGRTLKDGMVIITHRLQGTLDTETLGLGTPAMPASYEIIW